ICLGELLIDFVALETDVEVGDAYGFKKAPGGAPANVAVAAARLGHKAGFMGQVGDDPFGHFLAGVLQKDGVDIHGLRYSTEARTALAFVSLRADGERSFSFYRNPSADMLLRPGELPLHVIDDYQIFHFGSITLIDEPVRSATLEAVQYARNKGLMISYDPNLRLMLWENADAARAGMLSGFEYASLVKISEEELVFLTGGHDVTPLWRDSIQMIVITRGADGATIYTKGGSQTSAPGYSVKAVDTTGAGDSFVAGLLDGILTHGDDYPNHLPEILRFANAVGAITTTKRGAIPALPKKKQALALMNKEK
ncbi:MAG TPA: PfkB family carbohydrate kinase, partial [Phototrophicaceae bacterium]|nr:PfkB family carbohydrate kinase [Phototrophicaceae bacterium]